MIRKLFGMKLVRFGLIAVVSVFLFVALCNLWVTLRASGRIFYTVEEVPSQPVALVLGTSKSTVYGGTNAFFSTRMDAAAELYRNGKVKRLIVSGDNGHVSYNETRDMRKALNDRGVPNEAITQDFAGFRTLDSVVRAKEVFGADSLLIISQEFHLSRAIFIARAHGMEAIGYASEDPAHNGAYFKVLLREWLARVGAVLDCYILGTRPKFSAEPEG